MADWVKLDSSNLKRAQYNKSTEALKIQFSSGSIYRYFSVPEDVYEELLDPHQSTGSFFAKNIRNDYQFIKLSGGTKSK